MKKVNHLKETRITESLTTEFSALDYTIEPIGGRGKRANSILVHAGGYVYVKHRDYYGSTHLRCRYFVSCPGRAKITGESFFQLQPHTCRSEQAQ